MARPKQLVEDLIHVLQESGNLPDSTTYVGYEPNIDTDPIKLPLVEIVTITEARIDDSNTDFEGYVENENGNKISKVFHALYNLTVEVNVWTAQGSKYDPRDLGDSVYSALYPYDSSAMGHSFNDDVWRVRIGEGEPDEDFSTSPTLRRWSQEVDLWAYEQFVTNEEFIEDAVVPTADDIIDSSVVDGVGNV